MWVLIFAALLIAGAAALVYLVSRIARFNLVIKISKGNKIIKAAVSALIVLGCSMFITILIGLMNLIVCLLHLVVFWALSDVISTVIQRKSGNHWQRNYSGIFAITFTVIYLSIGWVLAHHVWETKYVLDTDKEIGSFRVIQFADSHVGTTFSGQGLEKYVMEMNEQNPDVVLITGDYVDDDTSREDMIAACEALGKLHSTYGVYYAFGNHDKGYYGSEHRGYSGDDLIHELEKNGVTVLQDETVLIDNRVYIIGRQDRSEEMILTGRSDVTDIGGGRASMMQLTEGLDDSKYIIVLDHQPHDYQNQADVEVDLVLSGHTHGGQLLPINFIGELTGANDKTYGLEHRYHTDFIVTSGISDWALKFKTGCKSEYVLIDINND